MRIWARSGLWVTPSEQAGRRHASWGLVGAEILPYPTGIGWERRDAHPHQVPVQGQFPLFTSRLTDLDTTFVARPTGRQALVELPQNPLCAQPRQPLVT